MVYRRFVWLLFLLSACTKQVIPYRVGVDPTWTHEALGDLEPRINGYVDDLLLLLSEKTGIPFVKVAMSWDREIEGLMKGEYDAMISSMPPYSFNLDRFAIGENIFSMGSVLIAPKGGDEKLEEMKRGVVGIVQGEETFVLVSENSHLTARNYPSAPVLLEALEAGAINAALLPSQVAIPFLKKRFFPALHIVGNPLTNDGLHFVSRKNGREQEREEIEKALQKCKKKGIIDSLLDKWSLR